MKINLRLGLLITLILFVAAGASPRTGQGCHFGGAIDVFYDLHVDNQTSRNLAIFVDNEFAVVSLSQEKSASIAGGPRDIAIAAMDAEGKVVFRSPVRKDEWLKTPNLTIVIPPDATPPAPDVSQTHLQSVRFHNPGDSPVIALINGVLVAGLRGHLAGPATFRVSDQVSQGSTFLVEAKSPDYVVVYSRVYTLSDLENASWHIPLSSSNAVSFSLDLENLLQQTLTVTLNDQTLGDMPYESKMHVADLQVTPNLDGRRKQAGNTT